MPKDYLIPSFTLPELAIGTLEGRGGRREFARRRVPAAASVEVCDMALEPGAHETGGDAAGPGAKEPVGAVVSRGRRVIMSRTACGADDCVLKPFQLQELEARVRALLRRKAGHKCKLSDNPLGLDRDTRRASLRGGTLELTTGEWRMLEFLILRVGKVVTKEELRVLLCDEAVSRDAVEVHVSRLRVKLGGTECVD
jgi:hypothetical protein